MPDDILISELSNAPQIDDSAVFPLTQDNGGSPATFKATMSQIAGKIGEGTTFANLHTTSKTLVGALNELKDGGGGSAELIGTASGSIATFSDGGNNIPMKSCEVEIVAQQAGSGTPSPSNPRAISGFDSVDVVVCGKNLADQAQFIMGSINGTGNDTESYTRLRSPFIKVNSNTVYAFATNSSLFVYEIHEYTKDKLWIQYSGINSTSGTISTTANTKYIKILIRKSDNSTIAVSELTSLQMEQGSTSTAYEAYNGSTYSLPLPSTCYGGTAELVGGNGTKTYEIVDLGSLTWTLYDTGIFKADIPTKKNAISADVVDDLICSSYETATGNQVVNRQKDKAIGGSTANGRIFLSDSTLTSATIQSALNGVKLVFALATPTAFTFTGATIPTLSGVNNVYADSGDVDVEYFNENADEIAELVNVYPYEVSGVLATGQTSITLSSGLIKADSTIDVYTSDGTNYNSVSVSSGSITITFDAQVSNLGVKVRVS